MVSFLIELSLRQRILVIIMTVMLAAGGLYAFQTMPIDAFPDVTTVLVQVVTKSEGFSPAEIERFVRRGKREGRDFDARVAEFSDCGKCVGKRSIAERLVANGKLHNGIQVSQSARQIACGLAPVLPY